MDELENIVKSIQRKLDAIALVILGDPPDVTKPGVMIRLDRLERADRAKTKLIWLLGSGMVAAAGKRFFKESETKRSITFAIEFQAPDRTLTADEIDQVELYLSEKWTV